jgi:O-antigen biosynthesis protein WbqP
MCVLLSTKKISLKRIFDITLSGTALILLSPLLLSVAILVLFDDGRPVIFKQMRVGKDGELFCILKFRTMKTDAPCLSALDLGEHLQAQNCYIRSAKFLRKTSIDELPQLFNILRGDMSFVGFRPLIPQENEIRERRAAAGVYQILPGLTGWAQINGRAVLNNDEKLRLDVEYLQRRSFLFDIKIILHTAAQVFLRKNTK